MAIVYAIPDGQRDRAGVSSVATGWSRRCPLVVVHAGMQRLSEQHSGVQVGVADGTS